MVITCETDYPKSYSGKARKSVQIIYATLTEDGDDELNFHCVKKKFLFNNKMFDLGDIFGIKSDTSNVSQEQEKLCVICFTQEKDTVVLPCRHMCLCLDCSQHVREKSSNCPICRTKVSTFIQIKNESKDDAEEEEEEEEESDDND